MQDQQNQQAGATVVLAEGDRIISGNITASQIAALSLPTLPPMYPITGARTLSEEEVALMNEINHMGDQVHALIEKVRGLHMTDIARSHGNLEDGSKIRELARLVEQGQHWRMRAVDDLQAGFMKLKRAVARPTNF
jgi:hypothetical protein